MSGSLQGADYRERLTDVAGIVVVTGALLVYGVLQERIMTIGFGPSKTELFEHSIFLVLCNRLVTCVMCVCFMAATQRAGVAPAAPLRSYASVSLTNVVATSCQYEALKYVSFIIQTLAKSAKAMPVMIWGSLYWGKRYKPGEYAHACVIMLGCTVFIMTGDVSSRTVADKADAMYYAIGAGLMILYLAVDGLTSTWQDNLFKQYSMGIFDQVLYTTMFSTALSLVAAVASGQLVPSILFVARHSEALWWILALSAASAAVQLIISFTIKRFGAVVFATIMTTRQFFSVLLSCLIFWTPLTALQWVGVAIVFGALYFKVLQRGRQARSTKSTSATPAASPTHPVIAAGLHVTTATDRLHVTALTDRTDEVKV